MADQGWWVRYRTALLFARRQQGLCEWDRQRDHQHRGEVPDQEGHRETLEQHRKVSRPRISR
jgi:hypothetical protein